MTLMATGRLLIVSNRLPVTADTTSAGLRLEPASGGLVTGLRPWHESGQGVWIGWPGDVSRLSVEERTDLDRQLEARAIVPVYLSRDDIERYYHGFSNRVLWPLFHYLIDRVPVDATGWDAYRKVNEAFAAVVVREHRRGDTIWVHDYQLMLVPALLRQRLPDARIGFFLHIPFPSSEIFRVLPWRREVLNGILGADLVGFHTFAYMRHFLAALLHIDGVEADLDRVRIADRDVRLGVFPMGVDAAHFSRLASSPDVQAEAAAIRQDAGGRQIVLGVDRLDYTKGIPRRLQAVERLLARQPAFADTVRYIQIAVPSRGEVESYQKFKRQVEEGVGRINGARGTLRSTPVHYVHRSISERQLIALYSAADVMLVTPLRDGMNLVAKEFVASRPDEDGVLVLSEFAGASAELDGAVVVNPYDVDAVASTLHHALTMAGAERRARMQGLRRRVMEHDIHAWANGFVNHLMTSRPDPTPPGAPAAPEPSLVSALIQAQRTTTLRLLLDYDGTLVPFARSPELAAPDEELLALLSDLAAAASVSIDVVSGRPRQPLETWLGHLPLTLWAEHGFWHRAAGQAAWESAADVTSDWTERLRPILEQFTAATPGSRIEMKTASIAWHYRAADREYGARQAHELRMLLGDTLSNQPLEVIEGKKVIEVRLRGVSKALVGRRVSAEAASDVSIVAIGDDWTDEDMFRALPPASFTVAVGLRTSRARFRLDDHRAVRKMLRSLIVHGARSPA
ncbi:MAG TPA: bifunctional alpha,alpha-trehalose-phosphate synthase (UDP-forming)/trehalose-phosphatase [Vicinamibacterales bacterium]